MNLFSTIIGLCLALGGPVLVASIGYKFLDDSQSIAGKVLQQLFLVALLVGVLAVVLFGERQPLSSIGLHLLRWQSLFWGLIFAVFLVFIYSPLLIWGMKKLNFGSFETGLTKLTSLPIYYLVFAIMVGGIVEEVLYRGYATERLSSLTGSYWIGSILALIAFGLAHIPFWGWQAASTTILSGAILTIFYLSTGELLSAIVAHVITDSVGIIIPALSRLRKLESQKNPTT